MATESPPLQRLMNFEKTVAATGIKYRVDVDPFPQNVNLMRDLISFIQTNPVSSISVIDLESLYRPDPNFKLARDLIKDIQNGDSQNQDLPSLKDYDSLKWSTYSSSQYQISSKYKEDKNKKGLAVLISELLNISDQKDFIKVFIIGDYKQVELFANIIIDKEKVLEYKDKEFTWNGFTRDPYMDSKNDPVLNKSIDFYDRYVGNKWYVGVDNRGEVNNANILWMVSNPDIRVELNPNVQNINLTNIDPAITIGLVPRIDYMKPISKEYVEKLYLMAIAIIAATKLGGSFILKMPLPNIPALDVIIKLLSYFFSFVKIFRYSLTTPDDDTIYLVGTRFNPNSTTIDLKNFVDIMSRPELIQKILLYLSKIKTSAIYQIKLRDNVKNSILKHVETIANQWPLRNL